MADWSPERDRELARLWRQFDPTACADILGLPAGEVKARARQIGLARPPAWTPARISDLKRFWGEGRSAAKIAKLLGMSKNAVLGRAHRLGLPPRPTPIRNIWDQDRNAELTRRVRDGISAARIARAMNLDPKTVRRQISKLGLGESRSRRYTSEPLGEAFHYKSCQYPLWDDGPPTREFCGAPTIEGSSYCAKHHGICYVAGSGGTYPMASTRSW